MPLHVPVPLLVATCMHTTANIISDAFELTNLLQPAEVTDESTAMHEIRAYVSILPISLKERLLHHILGLDDLSAAVKYKALTSLLDAPMKSLSPGIFPQSYFGRISCLICCQGKTLEMLDLRGVWLKGELVSELLNILSCLQNLRDLRIPHMATNSVLGKIGEYNTLLQSLDISGECNITSAGIELLSNSGNSVITQNLKFLLLGNPGGTDVSPRVVSQIIKYFPKLQSLGSYPKVGQAMEYLLEEGKNITTNLTYLHDSNTDLGTMRILVQTTPMLQSIFIDHPSEGVILLLNHFSQLTKIKLQMFQVNELMTLLNEIGKNILILELLMGSGSLDLGVLSKQCPNLVKFYGLKMEMICHLNQIEFPNIKSVGICYSNINVSCVKSIAMGSPNIQKLSIGDYLEITDEDIFEIFTTCELNSLQHIWFPNAAFLTSASVQILIECCPNLISLGDLSGWNVSRPEVLMFQDMVENENLAIKFVDSFR